jgi:hypothetical protein
MGRLSRLQETSCPRKVALFHGVVHPFYKCGVGNITFFYNLSFPWFSPPVKPQSELDSLVPLRQSEKPAEGELS